MVHTIKEVACLIEQKTENEIEQQDKVDKVQQRSAFDTIILHLDNEEQKYDEH